MMDAQDKLSSIRTWIYVGLMLLLILLKGYFAFWMIGDRGQPTWDYGTIKDVPSQSPYAEYELLPHPQHVKGKQGK
jgi:hypothetical protein